ncbi:BRO-N domain-containing protein [Serratia marcescens]|uniref:BRO-N domain-containing protein n=1 Tax=Serratia marcescens TaxID=615 RepID=UPI00069CFCE2|nr:BRO family protein [Serratia marcescens]
MANQFVFQKHPLTAHNIDGQLWFEAVGIAAALGYANYRSVTGIYANHKTEFANDMSKVLDSSTLGKARHKTRIFSLRGVHLIAMLARTPVAEDFRKWVLDLIEKENVKQTSVILAPNRECLPKMVYHHQSKYNPYRAYVTDSGKSVYVGCYPTVEEAVAAQKAYFANGETKRIQLPAATVKDASLSAAVMVDGKSFMDPQDMVNHFATLLEAAQLLSCYKYGKDLAWDIITFTQEAARAAGK